MQLQVQVAKSKGLHAVQRKGAALLYMEFCVVNPPGHRARLLRQAAGRAPVSQTGCHGSQMLAQPRSPRPRC